MFAQLIASRPGRHHDTHGLTVSFALHGMAFAAAILATAPRSDTRAVDDATQYVPLLPLAAPTADPPPAARARPAAPSAAPLAAPPRPPEVPVMVTSVPDLPEPGAVSVTLPAPPDGPWAAPAGVVPGPGGTAAGTGTAPAGGLTGALAGGAYSGLQVDVPAALSPRSPLPRYPAALSTRGLEGSARLRFVVDARGRVELATVEVVESSHPAFAAAVRAALPRLRFSPARIGARAVRQLVEFPITFRLEP
jgi:periplasmic protein TonB